MSYQPRDEQEHAEKLEPIRLAGFLEASVRLKDLRLQMVEHLGRIMDGFKELGAEAIEKALSEVDVRKLYHDEAKSALRVEISNAARRMVRERATERVESDAEAWFKSDALNELVREEVRRQASALIERAVGKTLWEGVRGNDTVELAIKQAMRSALS